MEARLGLAMAFAAVVSAAGPSGCGGSDAVVAEKGLPDGGPQEGSVGAKCTDSSQCNQTEYCSKTSCNAAEEGSCQKKPPAPCGNTLTFGVCGCSGIQYWNDCLRKQNGEVFADPTACATPLRCDSTTDGACPAGYCALRSTCAPSAPSVGFCLVLPDVCPTGPISVIGPISAPTTVVSCASGDAGACMDFCSAVKARAPFHEPGTAQQCP